MEIKRLTHFRTIVEAGGLAKAGGLLHLTAGALSKSIRQLENDLGRDLFHRSARKLQLTDTGTQLYNASEALMNEHARLLRTLGESEPGRQKLLRVASFEVFTTHTLAAVVNQGIEGLVLRVLELPVRRISDAVAEREADLGITYAPYPQPGLKSQRIGLAKFAIYGRANTFDETPFDALPFAIPTSVVGRSTSGMLGIDGWPYERITRHVRYELTSLESALALARSGHSVVFIPRFVANATFKRSESLVEIPPPKRLPRIEHAIYSVIRTEQNADTSIDRFIEKLVAVIEME